jgi:MFS family permease
MQITWGITLVLMLRSVGSIIFGIAADRYGRKVRSLASFEPYHSLIFLIVAVYH